LHVDVVVLHFNHPFHPLAPKPFTDFVHSNRTEQSIAFRWPAFTLNQHFYKASSEKGKGKREKGQLVQTASTSATVWLSNGFTAPG